MGRADEIAIDFHRAEGGGYYISETGKRLTVETIMKYRHAIDGDEGVLFAPRAHLVRITELRLVPCPICGENIDADDRKHPECAAAERQQGKLF